MISGLNKSPVISNWKELFSLWWRIIKSISSIKSSVNTIKIYGDEEVVSRYSDSYIPIEVDVTGLSENKTYTVVVPKTEGIREV